ncbi:hypothetical protein C0J52_25625 [Blattella germanica]|nr:hypothetical protein C0J52_25625 [Blattella germanica]
MEDSRPAKRVLLNNPGGQRYRGRPRATVMWWRMQEVLEYAIGLAERKTEKIGENSLGQPGPSIGCRADDDDDDDV